VLDLGVKKSIEISQILQSVLPPAPEVDADAKLDADQADDVDEDHDVDAR